MTTYHMEATQEKGIGGGGYKRMAIGLLEGYQRLPHNSFTVVVLPEVYMGIARVLPEVAKNIAPDLTQNNQRIARG